MAALSAQLPLRLHLARHGATEWSLSGRSAGRTDLPLSAPGEEAARRPGQRLRGTPFSLVLTSPLLRARRTCELAQLTPAAEIEPDLAEWDNGDYEGLTLAEIHQARPRWRLFRNGAPGGETPEQICYRVDRLLSRLQRLEGNIAVFCHRHLGCALAARWIGLPVEQGERLMLDTASLSILSFEDRHTDQPVIALWNSPSAEPPDRRAHDTGLMKRALERWENEGGEIPRPEEPLSGGRPQLAAARVKAP